MLGSSVSAEASAEGPLSLSYVQVRVWWPPTKDRKKTDFSGMYWPAKVVKHTSEGYEVQYDNGDRELVLSENVSPFNPPFNFGEEGCALQVWGSFIVVLALYYTPEVRTFPGQTVVMLTFVRQLPCSSSSGRRLNRCYCLGRGVLRGVQWQQLRPRCLGGQNQEDQQKRKFYSEPGFRQYYLYAVLNLAYWSQS